MLYLISIPSYHLIDNEIKKIVKDNDYVHFNMAKTTIKDIIDEASYYTLTGDEKYIVVSNANFFGSEKLDEKDSTLLLNYIKNPIKSTTIIFTTTSPIDLRKSITKEIKSKYKLININKFSYKDYESEINKYVSSMGFKIEYECISYLINNSYDNLDIIFNEIDKMVLYYNHLTTIKFKDLLQVVGSIIDSNNFHFVDAVINKNLKLSLKLFDDLKVVKTEPVMLISLLAREYRLMYYVKKMYQNKKTLASICSELKLQDWQVNKLYNNSIKYSDDELLNNLVSLCNCDTSIKKGLWDKDVALISFLLGACC